MKDSEILDIPTEQDTPIKISKWRPALLAILFLNIVFVLKLLFLPQHLILFFSFAPIILALYFFIKKVNHNTLAIGQLFVWSSTIVFLGLLIIPILTPFFFVHEMSASEKTTYILGHIVGTFLKSIVLGNLLSIGVFQFIKNKNWAMLILMIFTSWMLLTTFTIEI